MKLIRKIKSIAKRLTMTDCEKVLLNLKSPLPELKKGEVSSTYYVEVLSDCNLQCALCAFGSKELFQREQGGKMTLEKFEQILDKIKKDSPSARVSPYHHCEPMLHPQLPEMVKAVKDRGLDCHISFNFNKIIRLNDLLLARPDGFEISVSGFCQETYAKSHINGNIETVKKNMQILKDTMDKLDIHPQISIVYHMYKDNLGEDYDKMKEFSEGLGFQFLPCWSRCISLELSLKHLRENGFSRYKGKTLRWFDEIKPLNDTYKSAMERMIHLPEDYLSGKWEKIQVKTCTTNKRIINIRWNGQICLCGWAFDDRLTAGDFLTTPIEELYKLRKKHPVCKECLANNYIFYTSYVDIDSLNDRAQSRLGADIPLDRKLGI